MDWLQLQLGESDITFSRVTKAPRPSGAERKKTEKRKEQGKSEQGERSLPYPIVNGEHNGASNPSADATVFVLMQNGLIHN